jgi:hypothetical protein
MQRVQHGFIRKTVCPPVIVEGCFVDNAKDVQIADLLEEQKNFGVAYFTVFILLSKFLGFITISRLLQ